MRGKGAGSSTRPLADKGRAHWPLRARQPLSQGTDTSPRTDHTPGAARGTRLPERGASPDTRRCRISVCACAGGTLHTSICKNERICSNRISSPLLSVPLHIRGKGTGKAAPRAHQGETSVFNDCEQAFWLVGAPPAKREAERSDLASERGSALRVSVSLRPDRRSSPSRTSALRKRRPRVSSPSPTLHPPYRSPPLN